MPTIFPLSPILTLGITQIIGYGTLYYAFGVVAVDLSVDLGIGLPTAFAAFSFALLAGGAVAPFAGRQIDRIGARKVMAAGSVGAAAALACLSQVAGPVGLFGALMLVEGVAALVLYDAAFAALAQSVGAAEARRAITLMTLMGGLASTLFWPLTLFLAQAHDWRTAFLIFAALHLIVCLPLHLSLPRLPQAASDVREPTRAEPAAWPQLSPERQRRAMVWLAIGFSLGGMVMSAMASQWVPALAALGLGAADAVAAGVLMGPAQVAVRLIDLACGVRRHPLTMAMLSAGFLVAALAILVVFPPSLTSAMVFAVLYGLCSGLTSIVRGTVPLTLFGPSGFAARLGVLAAIRMVSSAMAPLAMALALGLWDARVALGLGFVVAICAMAALSRVSR